MRMTLAISCCRGLARLSRSAAKAAAAHLRRRGMLRQAVDWPARLRLCQTCPMHTLRGGVGYCGNPLLEQVTRDAGLDGCGCPTADKARSPDEHCPLNRRHRPAVSSPAGCDCKWCAAVLSVGLG